MFLTSSNLLPNIIHANTYKLNNYPSNGSTARDCGLCKFSVIILTIYSPSRLLAIIRLGLEDIDDEEDVTNIFPDTQSTANPSGISKTVKENLGMRKKLPKI